MSQIFVDQKRVINILVVLITVACCFSISSWISRFIDDSPYLFMDLLVESAVVWIIQVPSIVSSLSTFTCVCVSYVDLMVTPIMWYHHMLDRNILQYYSFYLWPKGRLMHVTFWKIRLLWNFAVSILLHLEWQGHYNDQICFATWSITFLSIQKIKECSSKGLWDLDWDLNFISVKIQLNLS